MRLVGFLLAGAIVAVMADWAGAQTPPFYSGGATAFDPVISVVNSGAILDAQAVVSQDRKYVTMTMRPSQTQVLAMRSFAFQSISNVGYAGGLGSSNPAVAAAAARSILNQPGMVRISSK